MCIDLYNFRDAICKRRNAIWKLYLGMFVVITTLLFIKYSLYNVEEAINTTAMNPKYNVYDITDCASSLYVGNFLTARYALDSNV